MVRVSQDIRYIVTLGAPRSLQKIRGWSSSIVPRLMYLDVQLSLYVARLIVHTFTSAALDSNTTPSGSSISEGSRILF